MFAPFSLSAGSQENPLVQAIKLYDQNNFKEAEKILAGLLEEKPDHLMVNYFYGACRTENQHYGQKEILYLLKGSTGESPLKTDYYLGVQYQAQNRWDEALQYYQMFEISSSKEAKELNVEEKIDQCNKHINPYKNEPEEQSEEDEELTDVLPAPIDRPEGAVAAISAEAVYPEADTIDSMQAISSSADSTSIETLPVEVVPEVPKPVKPKAGPIEFWVNEELTYIDTANFQTQDGLGSFLAWELGTKRLDSLNADLDRWRSYYAAAKNTVKRNELAQKIISAESEQLGLQKQTKEQLRMARLSEINFWNSKTEDEITAFSEQLKKEKQLLKQNDKTPLFVPDSALIPVEVFEEIAPVTNTPTPPGEKNELVYKIQIGAYSRKLPNYVKQKFDKLAVIRKIDKYTDDRGVVVYTTGNLGKLEDAVKMQKQVRQEGIEDAFVVPYFNGKRITLEEAKKIEQER